MSMSGLGGRPLLARSGAGGSSGSSALSSLMPLYRYRRSSGGSAGSRSLHVPASAVLERRRVSITPSPQPPSTVSGAIHETASAADDCSSDDVDAAPAAAGAAADRRRRRVAEEDAAEASALLIPDLDLPAVVIGQSRSDNYLADRAAASSFILDGFLNTT